jgi:NADPH:quinone reductase-like Zn-dependent oxidoreductase
MSAIAPGTPAKRVTQPQTEAAPAHMKAVVQHVYGGTDALSIEQIDVPTLREHNVRLRVRAAAINPADWAVARGFPYVLRLVYGLTRPRNPVGGSDVAGTVEAVGAAVTQVRVGDEVFGWCRGAFAEYAVASEAALVPKPATLSFEQAAATPMAAITALQALRDQARLEAGQTVLINGASGGVGTFAVQIAKALGADHVVDYTQEDFTRATARYDVILDNVGNHTLGECRRALTPTGILIPNSMAGNRWFASMGRVLAALATSPFLKQKLRPFFSIPKKADLEAIVELINVGKVTPVIDSTHPLDATARAIAHLGDGHARGKVIITI